MYWPSSGTSTNGRVEWSSIVEAERAEGFVATAAAVATDMKMANVDRGDMSFILGVGIEFVVLGDALS